MTVNSINNILYLKDMKLDQDDAKKFDRKKTSDQVSTHNKQSLRNAREVANENRTAGNPSIEDFDHARQVLSSLVDMLDQKYEKAILAHSGKAVGPVIE